MSEKSVFTSKSLSPAPFSSVHLSDAPPQLLNQVEVWTLSGSLERRHCSLQQQTEILKPCSAEEAAPFYSCHQYGFKPQTPWWSGRSKSPVWTVQAACRASSSKKKSGLGGVQEPHGEEPLVNLKKGLANHSEPRGEQSSTNTVHRRTQETPADHPSNHGRSGRSSCGEGGLGLSAETRIWIIRRRWMMKENCFYRNARKNR